MYRPRWTSRSYDVARRCGLLQPRREVYGVPGDKTLTVAAICGHDFPGIDADPHLQRYPAQSMQFGVEISDRGYQLSGSSYGTQRIVFVQDWNPEHRHHGVTDELLDRAAVPHQGVTRDREVQLHDLSQSLRVQPLP
jgi:hypothetical protein